MSVEPKTIPDIVANLRESADRVMSDDHNETCWNNLELGGIYYVLANEIEAAWKNEAGGNTAKMREALDFCVQQMSDAICDKNFGDDVVYLVGCMKTCIDFMKIALAAPARNCDVGTDEEQGKRLRRFCLRQKWCDHCPLRQRSITQADCKLLWAQMPYDAAKESEAK